LQHNFFTFPGLRLDSGESNEHLEAAPNQFRRDLETAMASEREESQQDSEMGSEEEVKFHSIMTRILMD